MRTIAETLAAAAANIGGMAPGEDKALHLCALQDARHFARCGREDEARKALARVGR
jgi:hypothetical protein